MGETGGEFLIRKLKTLGVKKVFTVPGEEIVTFYDLLRKSTDLDLIVCHQENDAGLTAANYARFSSEPTCLLTTCGPGAANCVLSAAYAQMNRLPLVIICGQKSYSNWKRFYRFQYVDEMEIFKTLVTKRVRICEAEVHDTILASDLKSGPVLYVLHQDMTETKVTVLTSTPELPHTTVATDEALAVIANALKNSRWFMAIGQMTPSDEETQAVLKEFATAMNCPVVDTEQSKGIFDATSQLYFGTKVLPSKQGDKLFQVLGGLKCLGICFSPFCKQVFPESDVINIGTERFDGCTHNLICDVKKTLMALQPLISEKQAIPKVLFERSEGSDLRPENIVRVIEEVVNKSGASLPPRVVLDNGQFKTYFARDFKCIYPKQLVMDNTLATMSAGIPSGVASLLHEPERPVVCVVGDGGLLMTPIGCLRLLSEKRALFNSQIRRARSFTLVNFDSKGYGMIEYGAKYTYEKEDLVDSGLLSLERLNDEEFSSLARVYDAEPHPGTTLINCDVLKKELEVCIRKPGIHMLQVRVNYKESDEALQT